MRAAYIIAAGAGLGALLLLLRQPNGAGYAIGSAAVDMVDGVVSGVVLNVGDSVGVPRTNETECERAKREGRTWDASFACPAGDFLRYVFS